MSAAKKPPTARGKRHAKRALDEANCLSSPTFFDFNIVGDGASAALVH